MASLATDPPSLASSMASLATEPPSLASSLARLPISRETHGMHRVELAVALASVALSSLTLACGGSESTGTGAPDGTSDAPLDARSAEAATDAGCPSFSPIYECEAQAPNATGCTAYPNASGGPTYPPGCSVKISGETTYGCGNTCPCQLFPSVEPDAGQYKWVCGL
jgi:hypothetical protein